MRKETIHVYCVPGMAAGVNIFEYVRLPEYYKIHMIPWEIPRKEETLQNYAKRLSLKVTEPNAVLLGVSFGGIVVQEMNRFLKLRKLIIISSVKTKYELPKRFEFVRKTKIYKILPTSIIQKVDSWEDFLVTKSIKKIGRLYDKYMVVKDEYYLDWSIENVISWKQEEPIEGIIHIHGNKDFVFPMKNIKNCIIVPKGTHAMIVIKGKWFSENLPEIIEN